MANSSSGVVGTGTVAAGVGVVTVGSVLAVYAVGVLAVVDGGGKSALPISALIRGHRLMPIETRSTTVRQAFKIVDRESLKGFLFA